MNWDGVRVLVTGVSGFVGPLLAKSLISRGADVYGLVRSRADKSTPQRIQEIDIEDKVTIIKGDLTNLSGLLNVLQESEPEVVFHLGGISHVHYSFNHPAKAIETNILGTSNLLESIRIKDINPVFVFAGSSEEYGLVLSSEQQYESAVSKFGTVFPPPSHLPELPVSEMAPLRPMSPYAVSKVAGDFLTRNYWTSYGLRALVSRAFNHEGVGRGANYVTSSIVNQVVSLRSGKTDRIRLGNVTAFRDWSGVDDVIEGYILLAERGESGNVYNQGSMRTNSVLTYLLWTLVTAGYPVASIESINGSTCVDDPTELDTGDVYGLKFEKTKIDRLLLEDEITFDLKDEGILVRGPEKPVKVEFDKSLYRPSEVPILLSDSRKIQRIGARFSIRLRDIIKSQVDHYSSVASTR